MARTNQKLINYHGSSLSALEAAKANLEKGEIAVVHNGQNDSYLAIKNDANNEIVLFATSGAVFEAIHAVEVAANAANTKLVLANGTTHVTLSSATSQADSAITYTIGESNVADADALAAVSAATAPMLTNVSANGDSYVSASFAAATGDNYAKSQALTVETNASTDIASESATGKVADAYAVKQYVGTVSGNIESTINTVSGNIESTINTVSANIESTIEALATSSEVTVEKLDTATSGYIASYIVKQNGTQVGATIDIPKDYLVKSATIETCTVDDQPVAGFVVGDKYIDFVINSKDGSGNESHIYLNVKDLAHVYTEGNYIDISSSDVISVDVADITGVTATGHAADAYDVKQYVGTVSGNIKTTIETVSGNIESTINTVSGNIESTINSTIAGLDSEKNFNSANGDLRIDIKEEDGIVTIISGAITSNYYLSGITATGDSYVTASVDTKANNTQKVTVGANVETNIASAAANKLADAQAVKSYVDTVSGYIESNIEAIENSKNYQSAVTAVQFDALTAGDAGVVGGSNSNAYESGVAAKVANNTLTLDFDSLVIDCGTF